MEFLSIINGLGTIPLLILLIVVFIILIKDIKKENESIKRQMDSVKKSLSESLDKHETAINTALENQNERLEKLDERIRHVETDYADRIYTQEIASGWRTEIRRLDEKLDKVLLERRKND